MDAKLIKTNNDYCVGMNLSTNAVGCAVTDMNYNIKKHNDKQLFSVRRFGQPTPKSKPRKARCSRRTLNRKQQRVDFLELLFNNEIMKADPLFFYRLSESRLLEEDKVMSTGKYTLFNDASFTDKDYYDRYPTIYHLRNELMKSTLPHDARLVYLALAHIIKNRGHFLSVGNFDKKVNSLTDEIDTFFGFLRDEYEIDITIDKAKIEELFLDTATLLKDKKKTVKELVKAAKLDKTPNVNVEYLLDLFLGSKIEVNKLFKGKSIDTDILKNVCLNDDFDEKEGKYIEALNDDYGLIVAAKNLYDSIKLIILLGNCEHVSEAKIASYELYKKQLAALKNYIRTYCPDSYKDAFVVQEKSKDNYVAYNGFANSEVRYKCTQEKFCKYLTKLFAKLDDSVPAFEYMNDILNETFLTKQRIKENNVLPKQLHEKELKRILENASGYLPFLNKKDENGLSAKDKVLMIFNFRIPYFVGPTKVDSYRGWVVRNTDKITPYNFEEVVDLQLTAVNFIERLIGRCTYTFEKVLPADSLLYSEYNMLNEINSIKVNGKLISVADKKSIVENLFVKKNTTVKKTTIHKHLIKIGSAKEDDVITGIDDVVKAKLTSFHDFKDIISRTGDLEMIEDIILHIVIFGDIKKMLVTYINDNYPILTEDEINHICSLNYSGWGRLSRTLLTGLVHKTIDGREITVIDEMREKNENLMQVLFGTYHFKAKADEYKKGVISPNRSLEERYDEMYLNVTSRRTVTQALRMLEEIISSMHCLPKKIFIENLREDKLDLKNTRTATRKEQLINLYKEAKLTKTPLYARLLDESEERLNKNKYYLYYMQLGKDMYTGKDIEYEKLSAGGKGDKYYNQDHIFPRSKIKDDSLDNLVLVNSTINGNKTDIYPVPEKIRTNCKEFWKMLKTKKLISSEKYSRLIRSYGLTDAELRDFIARQLVETSQAARAFATIVKEFYPTVKVVYTRVSNVNDFRGKFNIVKNRDINDFHYARDAYLDIVVGNTYDTKFSQEFLDNIKNEKYSLRKIFDYDVPGAWDAENTIKTVRKVMKNNFITVSYMPTTYQGALFDIKPVPAAENKFPLKKGLDPAKYGGYNSATTKYYFVVEHECEGQRVRSIEAVYTYCYKIYESDPIKYCEDILHLVNPVIVYKKMMTGSMLEINNSRFIMNGRTGNYILRYSTNQFIVDDEKANYLKKVAAYYKRCSKDKIELPVFESEAITKEKNYEIYKYFIEKLSSKPFAGIYDNVLKHLKNREEQFVALNLYEQSCVIVNLVGYVKCDRCSANLSWLYDKKKYADVGILKMGKTISSYDSVYLIEQSVTGFYEKKFDLLNK